MMKRLISVILCITLLLSFLSAYAAAETIETDFSSSIPIGNKDTLTGANPTTDYFLDREMTASNTDIEIKDVSFSKGIITATDINGKYSVNISPDKSVALSDITFTLPGNAGCSWYKDADLTIPVSAGQELEPDASFYLKVYLSENPSLYLVYTFEVKEALFFKTSFEDPAGVIDRSKAMIVSKKFADFKDGTIVESNFADDTVYAFVKGENAFDTYTDALDYAEENGIDTPHILVFDYTGINKSSLNISKPAHFFTKNYNVNPVISGTAPDGSDWSGNIGSKAGQFNPDNSVKISTLTINSTAEPGDYKFYGFTLTVQYKDNTLRRTNINVEFVNTYFNRTTWTSTLISFGTKQTSLSAERKANNETFKMTNTYFECNSFTTSAKLAEGTLPATVIFDNFYMDVKRSVASGLNTHEFNCLSDNRHFEFRNSCLKNFFFRGTTKFIMNTQTGNDITESETAKLIFDGCTLVNFSLSGKGIFSGDLDGLSYLQITNNKVYNADSVGVINVIGSMNTTDAAKIPMKLVFTGNYINAGKGDTTLKRTLSADSVVKDNYFVKAVKTDVTNATYGGIAYKVTDGASAEYTGDYYIDSERSLRITDPIPAQISKDKTELSDDGTFVYPVRDGDGVVTEQDDGTCTLDLSSILSNPAGNKVQIVIGETVADIGTVINNLSLTDGSIEVKIISHALEGDKTQEQTLIVKLNLARLSAVTVGGISAVKTGDSFEAILEKTGENEEITVTPYAYGTSVSVYDEKGNQVNTVSLSPAEAKTYTITVSTQTDSKTYTLNLSRMAEIAENVIIDDSVEIIAESAFEGNTTIKTAVLGSSVKKVSAYAFQNCTSLTTIVVKNKDLVVDHLAFSGCSALKKIIFIDISEQDLTITVGDHNLPFKSATKYYNPVMVDDHIFIDQSALCEFCGAIREHDHVYDSGCDTDCNLCNAVRTDLIHTYSEEGDYVCDVCSDSGSVSYIFDDETHTASAIGINSSITSAVIPEKVIKDGEIYTVTAVANNAFKNCRKLTSIEIPDSVTSIGNSAFTDCSALISVTIGNSVTSIGNSAFSYCGALTSIEIPDSVTSIGSYAFRECSKLTSVTLGNSVTTIGNYAFERCLKLTSIEIPDSVISIGHSSFSWCTSLTSIEIPDSVTSIGNDAFESCSKLTSIEIPDSVTSIGSSAFYNCSSLTSVTLGNSVTSIGSWTFRDCSKLTSVTIGNSVTSIESQAFYYCSALISIEIPDSVTSIGSYAFSGCSALTSIEVDSENLNFSSEDGVLFNKDKTTLVRCPEGKSGKFVFPDSVITVNMEAFSQCSLITSIIIPKAVSSIGYNTFYRCTSLTSFEVDSENQNYSSKDGVIFNKDKTTLIYCPGGKSGKYVIPDSVTNIDPHAFDSCTSLTSVVIPDSVTSIERHTFTSCTSLTSVVIPDSVTSIDIYAFYNCSSLTSVTLGNSVTSIGGSAFYNCSALTSIEIPDSVTSIESWAFRGCSALTSVTLGNFVTSIGSSAFYNCSALENVYYSGSESDKASITIDTSNEPLSDATWHYNCEIENGHVYDSACDSDCIVCGFVRTPPHSFAYICSVKCSDCEYEREAEHVYDNNCDSDCNECAALRTPPHSYVLKNNATYHWLICPDCRGTVNREVHYYQHILDNNCEVCNYVRTVVKPEISAVSLTLYNDIAYNVKVRNFDGSVDAKMKFTVAGESYVVTDYRTEGEFSVFTLYNVPPHFMTEDVTSTLILSINGKEKHRSVYTSSIEEYCKGIKAQDSYYSDIANAVLNYGAAAQNYRNYKTDILANRSLSATEKTMPAGSYYNGIDKEYFTVSNPLVNWKSYGLVLDSNVNLKLAFETDEDIKDLYVRVETEWGETVADLKNCFTKKDGKYFFSYDGFGINELDSIYLFTLFKDGAPVSDTLSYSVESYADVATRTNDEKLIAIIHALMNYGNIAKNY